MPTERQDSPSLEREGQLNLKERFQLLRRQPQTGNNRFRDYELQGHKAATSSNIYEGMSRDRPQRLQM